MSESSAVHAPSPRRHRDVHCQPLPHSPADARPLPWWPVFILAHVAALMLVGLHHPTVGLGVIAVCAPWLAAQLFIPSASGLCAVVTRFTTRRREIWLTIDDGPDPVTTPQVLDLLKTHRARATFFLIGERAARHPDLVAEILRQGHTVGNHTYRHSCAGFWCASPRRLTMEIDDCATAIEQAGARPSPWFRPPVGIKNPFLHRQLTARGLRLIMWSARGYDCVSRPAAALARINRDLRPGAIVLVHEAGGPDSSRPALLAQLLAKLSRDGYACVIPPADSLRNGRGPRGPV